MDCRMSQLLREETADLQLDPTAHGLAWHGHQQLPAIGCKSKHDQLRIHLQSHQEPSNRGIAETTPATCLQILENIGWPAKSSRRLMEIKASCCGD
jgi:hypothetical protein